MDSLGEYLLLLIRQFAGGPGPMENNFVRFGLAAVFWLALLVIAWTRQRNNDLPREKLLVWGFGIGLVRELIMFGLTTVKITGLLGSGGQDIYYYPLEHGLSMISEIVVAGAFLQYALKDELLAKRYIQIGLAATFVAIVISFNTWPKHAQEIPGIHFNETWESLVIHVVTIILVGAAIYLLMRRIEWLRVVVSIAFSFLLISETLFLISNAHAVSINSILCPISNAFHMLAIPLFGYVYLREMDIDKKIAEQKLDRYRNHLEDLVDERTSMLVAQNEIADSLSRSLDLETILNMALEKVVSVLSMEVGLIFLMDQESKIVSLGAYRGRLSQDDLDLCILEGCPYEQISKEAISKQAFINKQIDKSLSGVSHIKREKLKSLFGLPLISNDQVVGALTLGSKGEDPIDQTDLELLTAICNQIGMAVENANLYHVTDVWANELSTLHRASISLGSTLDTAQINDEIVIQSARLTGRQIACVLYWEGPDSEVSILSSVGLDHYQQALLCEDQMVRGLLSELLEEESSIVIDKIESDTRVPKSWKAELNLKSIFCTPIWGNDRPAEFLFVMDHRENKYWYEKDIELIESFVSRAAVALENANLYEQLEWAAALEERQRIAADLHDGLAQMISLIGYKIDDASKILPAESNGELSAALADIRETVGQAMVEARKSISSLQSDPRPRKSLHEILVSMIDKWSTEWADKSEIEVKYSFSFLTQHFLPSDQIVQLIPIIQEAMINAWKHSGATDIVINGEDNEDLISITIEDNGTGFDVDNQTEQDEAHFGIKIMRARAERFGGDLQIDSRLGNGTAVTISWKNSSIIGIKKGRENSEAEDLISTMNEREPNV